MKEEFKKLILNSIEKLQRNDMWPRFHIPEAILSYPNKKEHGDISTNIAMQLAKILKKSPMEIGEEIVRSLYQEEKTQKICKKIDLLHPGFINCHLNSDFLYKKFQNIVEDIKTFGKNNTGKGKKILVEFISANPTGPLTLANGRGGFTGDVLANIFSFSGYKVVKEYYLNDIGNQIQILAESVARKKFEQSGVKVDFPEDMYQGDYIDDIAKKLKVKINKALFLNAKPVEVVAKSIQTEVLEMMIEDIKRVTREVMGIKYHQWFRESSLYTNKNIQDVIQDMIDKNLAYKKDGAVWFHTEKYGDDKDRVIQKASGDQTYFLSDILYLSKRFNEQKYQQKIYILGADHHGYIKRIQAIAEALGHKGKAQVMIMQMVRLMKDGKEARMSKRKGNFVRIEELINDVSLDVARYFFLMYSSNTHMDFNLDLAKEHSEKNPVYYIQYAHARICSIEREMKKRRIRIEKKNMQPFTHEAEAGLVKTISQFPEVIAEILQSYEVHLLPAYATDLARQFHNFYSHCRVIEDGKVHTTRAYILQTTKQTLEKTLDLMGISAPEKME